MTPVVGNQTTIGTAAVKVIAASPRAQIIRFQNNGTGSIFLGGDPTVTATAGANPGYELKAAEILAAFQLDPEDDIFAISATGTNRLDSLQTFSA